MKLRIAMFALVISLFSLVAHAQESYYDALKAMQDYKVRGLFVLVKNDSEPSERFMTDVIRPLLPVLRKWYVIYVINVDEETDVAALYKRAGIWNGKAPSYYICGPGGKPILKGGQGAVSKSSWIKWHNDIYEGAAR